MARVRQQQATEQTAEFLYDNQNQSFSNGVMQVGGMPQVPTDVQTWKSSNGNTVYTTVKWRDPTTGKFRTSCNCPGWAIKRGNKTYRECCHTKDMEGVATCKKERGTTTAIKTVEDAVKSIPDMEDGRELRGIMIG